MTRPFTSDASCPVCGEDGFDDARSINAHVEDHENDPADGEQRIVCRHDRTLDEGCSRCLSSVDWRIEWFREGRWAL